MKLTPLALAAVAALSACSSTPPRPTTPNLVTNVNALRPGSGVVQQVMPTPIMTSSSSSSSEPLRRLEIKMSNGQTQYVDTPSTEIVRGDRVTISQDGIIRRG